MDKRTIDVAEDQRVLRPADHRARAHHGRDVAVDEALPRQVGDLDHLLDLALQLLAAFERFIDDHRGLPPRWRPTFVRVATALPMTATRLPANSTE